MVWGEKRNGLWEAPELIQELTSQENTQTSLWIILHVHSTKRGKKWPAVWLELPGTAYSGFVDGNLLQLSCDT